LFSIVQSSARPHGIYPEVWGSIIRNKSPREFRGLG
jgi:hypothetical protein